MPSLQEQSESLARWSEEKRAELERADWSAAFKSYPRLNLADEPVPWTLFSGDLAAARIALITSAGLYIEGDQEPFDAADPDGDVSYRVIPLATPSARLGVAHDHYDHLAAQQDINCVFPVDRLRELAADGVIGGVVDPAVSFMGYNPDWVATRRTLVPAVGEQVAALRPDAALLAPV